MNEEFTPRSSNSPPISEIFLKMPSDSDSPLPSNNSGNNFEKIQRSKYRVKTCNGRSDKVFLDAKVERWRCEISVIVTHNNPFFLKFVYDEFYHDGENKSNEKEVNQMLNMEERKKKKLTT